MLFKHERLTGSCSLSVRKNRQANQAWLQVPSPWWPETGGQLSLARLAERQGGVSSSGEDRLKALIRRSVKEKNSQCAALAFVCAHILGQGPECACVYKHIGRGRGRRGEGEGGRERTQWAGQTWPLCSWKAERPGKKLSECGKEYELQILWSGTLFPVWGQGMSPQSKDVGGEI